VKPKPWTGPSSLTWLAATIGALTLVAALAGVVLVGGSSPDQPGREIGRWLLQVAVVLAGTGVLSIVLRQSELSRLRREEWAENLHALIGAHDAVLLASRLLNAHPTPKIYAAQIDVILASRATLRRLASAPRIEPRSALHNDIMAMRKQLKDLVLEYCANYAPVMHQQRLDEVKLASDIDKLVAHTDAAVLLLPEELRGLLPSEEAMQDEERFPELYNLRVHYGKTEFRRSYKKAKVEMQRLAGIPVTDKPGEEESEEQF